MKIAIAPLTGTSIGFAPGQDGFQPASTNVRGAAYPSVDAGGPAQFRVKTPEAVKVQLNFWGAAMLDLVKQADGYWAVTSTPFVPGFHYYTLLIDGAEVSDPGSHTFFGGGKDASGINTPEPGATYWLPQDVPHGQVARSGITQASHEAGATL